MLEVGLKLNSINRGTKVIGKCLVIFSDALNQQATLLLLKAENNALIGSSVDTGSTGGASETTRELTRSKDASFHYWFTGFAEGNGSWNVSDGRVSFILRQKDPRVLHFIRKHLGFGNVILAKDGFSTFSVTNWDLSKRLALIFNGNLVLTDTKQRYESYHAVLCSKFPDLPPFNDKQNIPSLQTAWLSGFTQANGGFNVSISKSESHALGHKIDLVYYVDHKAGLLKPDYTILELIKTLFNTGTVYNRSATSDIWRYETQSFNTAFMIISYFKKYPLVFNKHVAFLKWDKTYRIIKEDRLTDKNLLKIIKIRKACDSLSNT